MTILPSAVGRHQWHWQIEDETKARKAVRRAFWVLAIFAVLYSMQAVTHSNVAPRWESFAQAIIFVVLSLLVFQGSKWAAMAAAFYWVVGSLLWLVGDFPVPLRTWVLKILCFVLLLDGVRGAFGLSAHAGTEQQRAKGP